MQIQHLTFCSHYNFFFKIVFCHITTVLAFFNQNIYNIVKNIFIQVWLKWLNKFIIYTHKRITVTASNMFLVFTCIMLIFIVLSIYIYIYYFFGTKTFSKSAWIINGSFIFLSWFFKVNILIFLSILKVFFDT